MEISFSLQRGATWLKNIVSRRFPFEISWIKAFLSLPTEYARPDVIVNIISDMYGLRGMRINGQPLGYGQRYMGSSGYRGYTSRYSSRYGRPIDYWYTMRSGKRYDSDLNITFSISEIYILDPYGSAQRRKPSMIDYNDDYNSDYNDYYYDLYSKPKNRAETQRKGSNRAIFNFMLSAPNKRRN